MKTIAALALVITSTLTANAGSTFHPIICTTEYCCLTTNPADNNCCKTDADPCPIN